MFDIYTEGYLHNKLLKPSHPCDGEWGEGGRYKCTGTLQVKTGNLVFKKLTLASLSETIILRLPVFLARFGLQGIPTLTR